MQPAGDEKVLRMNKDKVFFSEYPNKTNVSKIRSGVRNDEERESRFMGNSKDSKAPLLERPRRYHMDRVVQSGPRLHY